MSDVLVVIDLQTAVLATCDQTEKVLANTAFLLKKARTEGVPVVFVQHDESSGMVRGSDGWQIPECIAPTAAEPRVFKRYRDSFANTDLAEVLASLAVPGQRQRLVIVGAKSNNCVVTTAVSALARSYDVELVTDAHTTSPLDLPSGRLTGVQISDAVNQYFVNTAPHSAYPGVLATTTTTSELAFDK
ncbi:MAG: isochorismatase family protein [Propionibacteriaceae bacterium]|jgi:nicotinamidase-related amidase|nr:isochorismatase family protein [Propionibacteriaceae bacterium]